MKKFIPAIAAIGVFALALNLQVNKAEATETISTELDHGCTGSARVCCANSTITHI